MVNEPLDRKTGTTGSMENRPVGEKIEQGWDKFRMKVRGKWNQLTDQDLDTYRGKRRDDLVGHISERTGEDRNNINRELDTYSRDTGYRFQ